MTSAGRRRLGWAGTILGPVMILMSITGLFQADGLQLILFGLLIIAGACNTCLGILYLRHPPSDDV